MKRENKKVKLVGKKGIWGGKLDGIVL